MKILCLYHNKCALELFEWLKEQGHETILCSEKITADWCRIQRFDLTVSYTYRYILSRDVIDALSNNAVNLHNSYLPWNRGADPNIWSILEKTPRGVSLHFIDDYLDQGDIIAQRILVDVDEEDTFETTYFRLDQKAKQLFKEAFYYYAFWQEMRKEAKGVGNYHAISDGNILKDMIKTYETKIVDFKKQLKS